MVGSLTELGRVILGVVGGEPKGTAVEGDRTDTKSPDGIGVFQRELTPIEIVGRVVGGDRERSDRTRYGGRRHTIEECPTSVAIGAKEMKDTGIGQGRVQDQGIGSRQADRRGSRLGDELADIKGGVGAARTQKNATDKFDRVGNNIIIQIKAIKAMTNL